VPPVSQSKSRRFGRLLLKVTGILCFTLIFTFICNDSGDQIKKNEVGGACSTYGGGEGCIQDFGGET
jgi:hypothetical protein